MLPATRCRDHHFEGDDSAKGPDTFENNNGPILYTRERHEDVTGEKRPRVTTKIAVTPYELIGLKIGQSIQAMREEELEKMQQGFRSCSPEELREQVIRDMKGDDDLMSELADEVKETLMDDKIIQEAA